LTVGGIASHAAGSAAAPTITATGDTNTGIFFPAADTIAFAEGGAEVMRIDSDGDVGIGTSSPLGRVHSSSASSGATPSGNANQLIAENSGNAGITIASGASSLGNLFFADSGDGADGYVQYDQSGRSMRFGTATAERARIDSSGNVGIGTSSPTQKLNVAAAGAVISLVQNTASTADARLRVQNTQSSLEMGQDGTGGYLQQVGAYPLSFFVNSAERARIDSSGNLLVGTTSQLQSSKLSVLGTGNIADFRTSSSSGYPLVCENTAAGSTSMIIFLTGASTTTVGSITYNGSLTLYNTTSDQRLKENIEDADSASSLIDSLKVRKFDWKESNVHQRYGFVAQELVTVVPEAVHQPEDTEAMMAVDYSKLVPMLIKEVQSLRQRITALESAP